MTFEFSFRFHFLCAWRHFSWIFRTYLVAKGLAHSVLEWGHFFGIEMLVVGLLAKTDRSPGSGEREFEGGASD